MKSGKDEEQLIVGFAWYKPTQWAQLLEVSEDADRLEPTYLEWLDNASKQFREMRRAGVNVHKIHVDVEDLARWCQRRELPVNGGSRAQYVSAKTKEEW